MSGVTKVADRSYWNFSISPSSLGENKELGKKLKAVTAEQIAKIADAIYQRLWERLNFKDNLKISQGTTSEWHLKSALLKKKMFISDLKSQFAAGDGSILLLGYPLEYSPQEILRYAVLFGEKHLPSLIGDELAARDQYRISFSLALQRTKRLDELSIYIIETHNDEELSVSLYSLEPSKNPEMD